MDGSGVIPVTMGFSRGASFFNIHTTMNTLRNIKIFILNYSQKTENGTVLPLKRGTTLGGADRRSGTVSEGSGTVPCYWLVGVDDNGSARAAK